ncbi:MAG: 4Fe-4S dicluster domain-containing protein [Bacteroidales bacterium]|nr:4Fe-4S dicluster domain-containing protein [Bacteroidales bacterium]
MGKLYDMLQEDIRYEEALNACINCGTCTALCPAAEFYDYDPRQIVDLVQKHDEKTLEDLLKSNRIWYCGECMSCVTRCPRNNAPGMLIQALRTLSQRTGMFTASEKGRQQLALKRAIGESILKHGYCVYPRNVVFERHPEAGLVWKWEYDHLDDVFERLGGNLDGEGPGVLRKIPQESLDELQRIFDVTGGQAFYDNIEQCSAEKAKEMGMTEKEYADYIFTYNSDRHGRE